LDSFGEQLNFSQIVVGSNDDEFQINEEDADEDDDDDEDEIDDESEDSYSESESESPPRSLQLRCNSDF
jgi:hypothetical protein